MKALAALVAVFAVQSIGVVAIHPEELSFQLKVGQKQCFTDTYLSNIHVTGEVLVVDGSPDMLVSYEVRDMKTRELLRARDHVEQDSFSFNAPHVPSAHDSSHGAHSAHNPPASGRYPGPSDNTNQEPREYELCFSGYRPHDWHHPETHDRHGLPPLPTRKIFVSLREGDDIHRISGQNALKNVLTKKSDLDTIQTSVDKISRQVTRLTREIDELRFREQLLSESGENIASRIHMYSLLACLSIAIAGIVSTYSSQLVLSKSTRR